MKSPRRAIAPFEGEELSEREAKYISCVLQVAAKQTTDCLFSRNYGGGCYNPYAVCASSIGTTVEDPLSYYDLDLLDDEELFVLGELRGIVARNRSSLMKKLR